MESLTDALDRHLRRTPSLSIVLNPNAGRVRKRMARRAHVETPLDPAELNPRLHLTGSLAELDALFAAVRFDASQTLCFYGGDGSIARGLSAMLNRLGEDASLPTILPVAADYTLPFELPEAGATATRTVIYFPGSTIGNFHPPDAIQFMRRLRRIADGVLIGVDLKKDKAILERAYDDAAGVTAAFNLNLLVRMQRELGAELDLDGFEHMARYDEAAGRIEMHLVSRRDQAIVVGNRRFDLRAGETIRSEVSYKYSLPEFATVAMESGWEVEQVWTDRQGRFSLQYLAAR